MQHTAVQDRTLLALESLATKGSARAQYELAQRYDGSKTAAKGRRNMRLALTLYCKAARQGHAQAAERAGRMLIRGTGALAPDEELGNAWLRKAKAGGKAPEKCEPPQFRSLPGSFAAPPAEIKAAVHKMAPRYGLDPNLVLAVIAVESAFRTDVVSHKNAMGLMQLIPETAARFGVTDPFDPQQNMRGGMMYLRWLLAYFEGDVTLALAGYNAGEGAVERYRGVPPYAETRDYVVKVHSLYKFKRHPYDASVTRSAGLPRAKEEVAELSYASSSGASSSGLSATGGKRAQPKSASIED
ncbi:MAG TPA: transglycosylase SLT domain-containing protein [Azospirillum sp.]|nr:transglycosylase SLT domain-containing protein [Azospirillum sp.]